MWERFNKNPTLLNEQLYKECRNKVNSEIRVAKREYETRLADKIKEDPKSFYAYVRSRSKVKVKIGPIKDNLGQVVSEDSEMVNIFNEYFSSVFTKEDLINIPKVDNMIVNNKNCYLEDIVINKNKIARALSTLKINKAAGVDDVHSSLIKGCADTIITPLELIF